MTHENLEKGFNKYDGDLNSFEYIKSMLGVFWGSSSDDYLTLEKIIETLLKLPYDIREKTIDEVLFVFDSNKGEALTMSLPVVITKDQFQSVGENYITRITKPVIMLNLEKNDSDAGKTSAIAHKIAHFILGHHNKEKLDGTEEKEANDLTEEWGFERCYDYSIIENHLTELIMKLSSVEVSINGIKKEFDSMYTTSEVTKSVCTTTTTIESKLNEVEKETHRMREELKGISSIVHRKLN